MVDPSVACERCCLCHSSNDAAERKRAEVRNGKTARATAGASCLVAGMLADPPSTAEWVFNIFRRNTLTVSVLALTVVRSGPKS
jgi:hypothetical protein